MSLDYFWFSPETLEAYGLSERYILRIWPATYETLIMVSASVLLGLLFGAPLGIFLATSKKGELFEIPWGNRVVGFIGNIFRSIPFIILVFAVAPFTKLLVGRVFSTNGAIVSLSIAAIPFIARLIEGAVREVDQGLVEAARAYGASPLQIVFKVLIPEALPGIILAATLAVISLIGYSAMVGALAAGGLGTLAYNYGYQLNLLGLLWAVIAVIVIMVQIIQMLGEWLSRRMNKRIRHQ